MLNNTEHHFFLAAFLSCLALSNLESFLRRVKTLNLSKSVSCSLLACLAKDLPKELSAKDFETFYLEIIVLNFPVVIPLPILRTCLVSWSLPIGMICLVNPSPSTRTLLSLRISTMVASFPSRGP